MSKHKPQVYGATDISVSAPNGSGSDSHSLPPSPRTPNVYSHLLPQTRPPRSPGSASAFSTETGLTQAEQHEYERGLLTWDRAKNWRFWFRWEWVPFYFLGVALAAGVCCVGVFHRQVRCRGRWRD